MRVHVEPDWQQRGEGRMSDAQRRLLNAACGDLTQLRWHGFRLTKDDYRHLLSGTVLGWRTMPACRASRASKESSAGGCRVMEMSGEAVVTG